MIIRFYSHVSAVQRLLIMRYPFISVMSNVAQDFVDLVEELLED